MTEALRMELGGEDIHVSLVMPGVVDTPLATNAQRDAGVPIPWPEQLNMPPSWVTQCIFLAIRFRLAEIAVPPGSALVENLRHSLRARRIRSCAGPLAPCSVRRACAAVDQSIAPPFLIPDRREH